jgi:flagellar motor switch protein FliM
VNNDDATVSPEELAALMETIRATAEGRIREVDGDGDFQDIVRYDLVASRAVGQGKLPTLDLVHDRFAVMLADTFRRVLGHQTVVTNERAEPLKFSESIGMLPSPYCIQVLELHGLRGTALLAIDPGLLFHLIDLLLGGNPKSVVDAAAILKERGLTGVERRLFAHLTRLIGAELTAAWDGVAEFRISPVRAETEPRQVAIFEATEMVVHTTFQVEAAGAEGAIHLLVPQSAFRPIEKKLASGLLESGAEEGPGWGGPLRNLFESVTVQCTAELGRTTLSLRELSALKAGDLIRLDRDPHTPITVYVEKSPKLLGSPTVRHGNIAVEVVAKVRPDGPRSDPKLTEGSVTKGADKGTAPSGGMSAFSAAARPTASHSNASSTFHPIQPLPTLRRAPLMAPARWAS